MDRANIPGEDTNTEVTTGSRDQPTSIVQDAIIGSTKIPPGLNRAAPQVESIQIGISPNLRTLEATTSPAQPKDIAPLHIHLDPAPPDDSRNNGPVSRNVRASNSTYSNAKNLRVGNLDTVVPLPEVPIHPPRPPLKEISRPSTHNQVLDANAGSDTNYPTVVRNEKPSISRPPGVSFHLPAVDEDVRGRDRPPPPIPPRPASMLPHGMDATIRQVEPRSYTPRTWLRDDVTRRFQVQVEFHDSRTLDNITYYHVGREKRVKKHRWSRIKPIGRGSFGDVWLESSPDPESVEEQRRAVKIIRKTEALDFKRELHVHAVLTSREVRTYFSTCIF